MSNLAINQVLQQMHAIKAGMQGKSADATTHAAGFGQVLKSAVNSLNETQQAAEQLKMAFHHGNPQVSLADVMVATQKANIGFQAAAQVRNRFIQAYQDIMNMSI